MEETLFRFLFENTDRYLDMLYLEDVLEHEDFILFTYIKEFSKRNVNITRRGLDLALENNSIYWIDSGSIYGKRKSKKVPKEYIDFKTKEILSTDADYAKVLKILVLNRYEEIMNNVREMPTENEIMSALEGHKIKAKKDCASQIITNVLPLIDGSSDCLYLEKTRYEPEYILEYLKDAILQSLVKIESATYGDERFSKERYMRSLSNEVTTTEPNWIWNLGMEILSNPVPGWMIVLQAPEKEGKTRFTVGEIVYPAICLHKNVKYYSGEMTNSDMKALLIKKHLYATQGIKLDLELVINVIIIASKIHTKTVNQKELDLLDSLDRMRIELILSAQEELFFSGKFGHVDLVVKGKDTKKGVKVENKNFIMQNVELTVMSELEAAKPESMNDVLIIDHVNNFSSSRGAKDTSALEEFYQTLKQIANNYLHPMTVVAINHTKTSQGNDAKKAKDFNGEKFNAHGTSEAGKSADISITLVSNTEQQRDGLTTLVVDVDRRVNFQEKFKTNAFVLVADRDSCDFCLQGQQKGVYTMAS